MNEFLLPWWLPAQEVSEKEFKILSARRNAPYAGRMQRVIRDYLAQAKAPKKTKANGLIGSASGFFAAFAD